MKKFWVYIHTCPNGKKYVGVTGRDPESRWKEGRGYQTNKHFYSAILKYGWTNFEHEVFEVDSKEEMYRKEVELISFYHSNDPEYGYNNSTGGEKSSLGCKHSEEYKKKISEAGKRVQKKVHSDPEYRKRISEANKKKWADPEYKKRVSEIQKKRFSDPEVRKNLSELWKERWADPEYRKKMSEIRKGKSRKPHSEETKEKMSKAAKKKYSDHPEYRKKLSEYHKGKPLSEETRTKISEAHKGKPLPRVKIQLPDGTILEITKQTLGRNYIKKGKEFEYVS